MGWFWAEPAPTSTKLSPASPPSPRPSAPPAVCPVRAPDSGATASPSSSKFPSCPVKSPDHPLRQSPAGSSPVTESQGSPGQERSAGSLTFTKLNPFNYMPSLPNSRPADSPQSVSLPLEREMSSIPRGDAETNWEYPSPQQMYNAMLRKGYTDTPSDAVESMVAVHNFLNEGAWQEIEDWERTFSQGLVKGWEVCSRGEQAIAQDRARHQMQVARRRALGLPEPEDERRPKLVRFMGRPSEPTPKARILSALGQVMPDKFGGEPPFDRHDWYVSRPMPDGSVKEVRYVIDYYGGGVQATGEPVFYLDIRPALDSPTAAVERAMRWGGDVWHRATGGAAREAAQAAKGSGSGS